MSASTAGNNSPGTAPHPVSCDDSAGRRPEGVAADETQQPDLGSGVPAPVPRGAGAVGMAAAQRNELPLQATARSSAAGQEKFQVWFAPLVPGHWSIAAPAEVDAPNTSAYRPLSILTTV